MIPDDWDQAAANYAIDPGFESGALRYVARTVTASVEDSSQIVIAPTISGARSLILSATANGSASTNASLISIGWRVPAAQGEKWSFGATCAYASAGYQGKITMSFQDAALSGLASASANGATAQSAPAQISILAQTAPLSTAWLYYSVDLYLTTPAGSVGSVAFDDLLLQKQGSLTSYFDGDTGGCSWRGARFYSTSDRPGTADSFAKILDWVPPYYYQ